MFRGRLKVSYLVWALVVGLLMVACGREEVEETPAVDEGPVEQITLSGPIVFDPATADDSDSREASQYIYEGLVTNEGGEIAPLLASGWTASDDELDYIFELRSDVSFSDGTPFNADAVLVNFNRWLRTDDPLHGSANYGKWLESFLGYAGERNADNTPRGTVDGIEKVNNLTVLIHLSRSDADFLSKLTDVAFGFASPAALTASGYGTMDTLPVGTGPYVVGEWTSDLITLTPNASYWLSEQLPEARVEITLE